MIPKPLPTEIATTDDALESQSHVSQKDISDLATNDKDLNELDYVTSQSEDDSDEDLEQANLNYILLEDKPVSEQIKIIGFEEAIVKAVTHYCLQCGSHCTISPERRIGSTCHILISCSHTSSHNFIWSTGPMINRLPAFHLLLAAGILSTGLESSKVIRMFDVLNIMNIGQRGLSNVLKCYVIQAVFQVWDREQKSNMASIKERTWNHSINWF